MNTYRQMAFAALGGIGLVLIVMSPVIFFGKVIGGGDTIVFQYPGFLTLWNSFRGSGSVLWSSLHMGGFPIYISQFGGLTDAVNVLLFRSLSFFDAYNSRLALDLLLSFCCMYALSWRISQNRAGAFLAASVYAFSQYAWETFAVFKWTNASFIIPMLLFIAHEGSRKYISYDLWKKVFIAALGGCALGWVLVGADIQTVIWAVLAAGVFAVTFNERIRSLAVLGAAGLIAAFLSWKYLFSSLAFSAVTPRGAAGLDFSQALSGSLQPMGFFKLLIPNFLLPHVAGTAGSIFFGAVPLLCVVAALVSYGSLRSRERFFISLGLFALIAMLPYSPLYWILHQLPVLNRLRGSYTFIPIFIASAAVLAASGLRIITESEEYGRVSRVLSAVRRVLIIALPVSVLCTLAILFFKDQIALMAYEVVGRIHAFSQNDPSSVLFHRQVIENYIGQILYNFSLGNPYFLFSMGTLAVGAELVRRRITNRLAKEMFGVLVVVATLCNLIPLFMLFQPYIPEKSYFSVPPTVEAVRARERGNNDHFRVVSFFGRDGAYRNLEIPYGYNAADNYAYAAAAFTPSTPILYALASMDGYDSFIPTRNAKLMAALGAEFGTNDLLITKSLSLEEKQTIYLSRVPALGMLNVRYIASAYPFASGTLPLIGSYEVTRHNVPVYLYEVPHAYPQTFFALRTMFVSSESDAYAAMLETETSSSLTAVIECSSCAPEPDRLDDGTDGMRIISERDGYAVFATNASRSRWLVFGQNNLPGWRATVDGSEVEVYFTNYLFQAIHVPAGTHRVEFSYLGVPYRK